MPSAGERHAFLVAQAARILVASRDHEPTGVLSWFDRDDVPVAERSVPAVHRPVLPGDSGARAKSRRGGHAGSAHAAGL